MKIIFVKSHGVARSGRVWPAAHARRWPKRARAPARFLVGVVADAAYDAFAASHVNLTSGWPLPLTRHQMSSIISIFGPFQKILAYGRKAAARKCARGRA